MAAWFQLQLFNKKMLNACAMQPMLETDFIMTKNPPRFSPSRDLYHVFSNVIHASEVGNQTSPHLGKRAKKKEERKMYDAIPAPSNILRGHKTQIQAAAFIRRNERLATADADGFIVLWDLAVMRPAAVWKAHDESILGVMGWGLDKIITCVMLGFLALDAG